MSKEETKSFKERRREPRIGGENKIFLIPIGERAAAGEAPSSCLLTRDISPGGCRILSDRSFPARTPLKIELVLSGLKKVIKTKGEVRWVKSLEDGVLFEMGIEFLDLPTESLGVLLEYSYKEARRKKNLR